LAAPLKDSFGPEIPRRIGEAIAAVDFRFPVQAFLTDALDAYEALELTPRARHIAIALRRHLPADYEDAIDLLLASLGPRTDGVELSGMAAFFYVDLRIRFVKSGGGTSPRVFKAPSSVSIMASGRRSRSSSRCASRPPDALSRRALPRSDRQRRDPPAGILPRRLRNAQRVRRDLQVPTDRHRESGQEDQLQVDSIGELHPSVCPFEPLALRLRRRAAAGGQLVPHGRLLRVEASSSVGPVARIEQNRCRLSRR
jgi:hypothetical protein